jgi:hypothetical protein
MEGESWLGVDLDALGNDRGDGCRPDAAIGQVSDTNHRHAAASNFFGGVIELAEDEVVGEGLGFLLSHPQLDLHLVFKPEWPVIIAGGMDPGPSHLG